MKTTKYLIAIPLLCLSLVSFAQVEPPAQANDSTSKKTPPIRGYSSITTSCRPLYVIDGMIIAEEDSAIVGRLDTAHISEMHVLKDAAASALYGSRASLGVIIINTKGGFLKKYQAVLSAFSSDYARLSERYKEEKLLYILNGNPLAAHNKYKLAMLGAEDIREVKVLTSKEARKKYQRNGLKGAVLIMTKEKINQNN